MPLSVEWVLPHPDNPYAEIEAVVSEAKVRVLRNKDRAIVVDNADANVDGNRTSFIVPPARMVGGHTAYMTVTFNDDTTLTREVAYYVRQK